MELQPIETAPHDRDVIGLWYDGTGQIYADVVRFVAVEDWVEPDTDEVDGWWTFTNALSQEMRQPTHWLPLMEF